MKKVTVRAKTVEEAVKSALSQLQTTEEFVNIRVIEEPSRGFFGFGAKQAVIEVERIDSKVHTESSVIQQVEEQIVASSDESEHGKDELATEMGAEDRAVALDEISKATAGKPEKEQEQEALEEASLFLESVLAKMDLVVKVKQEKHGDEWLFDVSGPNLGVMIGRRGQTLDALQYLTNIVANRYSNRYIRIVIDAENYRAKRKETLEQLADRVAKKVIRTHNKVALEPMNAAERKIIHSYLQHYAGVATKSDGVEPKRHIVIYPK